MKRKQADRATRPEVLLHISRQRNLGELMIGDHDRPRAKELVTVIVLIAVIFYARYKGWM